MALTRIKTDQIASQAVQGGDIDSTNTLILGSINAAAISLSGNITTLGELRGPETFIIDPTVVGDNTGTVVIKGNLQVDGLTTTINSTTLTIDDKNIVLADGAANAAAADGAGITVAGASATLLYSSTPDAWSFNKSVGIGTTAPTTKLHVTTASVAALPATTGTTLSAGTLIRLGTSSDTAGGIGTIGLSTNQMWIQVTDSTALGTTYPLLLNPNGGNVGIGTASPTWKVDANLGTITSGSISTGGYNVTGDAAGAVGYTTYNMQLNNTTANASGYMRLARTSSTAYLGMQIGSQSRDGIAFLTGATTPAEIARFDASGNVLVGHTATVAGASGYVPPLQVSRGDTNSSGIGLNSFSSGSGSAHLSLNRSKSSTIGTNTIVVLDDVLGNISFSGADGAGFIRGASISAFVDGTPGVNDMPGRLVFSTTADGASNVTERMRIDSSGNLGLGVIPNTTWFATRRVLQIGQSSSIASSTNSNVTEYSSNAYINTAGNDVYLASDFASRYRQISGQHQWFNAPSGTAGASAAVTSGQSYTVSVLSSSTLAQWQAFFSALTVLPTVGQVITATATGSIVGGGTVTQNITFTQGMTLDASGNVGIGDTGPSSLGRLVIAGATQKVYFAVNDGYAGPSILSASGQILCINPAGRNTIIGNNGTSFPAALSVRQGSSGVAPFSVENTTADASYLYVNSTGSVGVGTASPVHKLDVYGAVRGHGFRSTPVATPATPTATGSATGGSLAAGTYYFKIVAVDGVLPSTGGVTLPSAESTVVTTTGTTSSIAVAWTATDGAKSYQVWYSTTTGTQANYFAATTNSFSFTTTTGNTAGTIPAVNTTGKILIGATSLDASGSPAVASLAPLQVMGPVNGLLGADTSLHSFAIFGGAQFGSTQAEWGGGITLKPLIGRGSTVFLGAVHEGTNMEGGATFVIRSGSYQNTTTEKMRITSAGNVGIGNTNPTAKLDVTGTTNLSAKLTVSTFGSRVRNFEAYGSEALLDASDGTFDLIIGDGGFAYMSLTTTDNATALKIRNYTGNADIATFERVSGNVGIGTTSPVSKLHVLGTGTLGYATANAITSGMSAISNASAFNNIGAARLTSNFGGAVAFTGRATELVFTGDNGNFGSGGGFAQGILGSITAQSETGNAATFASSMIFYTTTNNALNERMRIDSSGNVGIGTSSPSTYGKFVVAGGDGNTQFNVGTSGVLRVAGYSSTYSGALLESVNTAQSAYLPIAINGSYAVVATGGTERLRINSSGNVGIGTSSPVTKLTVNGDTNISAASNGNSYKLYFGDEVTSGPGKAIFMEGYYMKIQGHRNEGIRLQGVNAAGAVQEFANFYGDANAYASQIHLLPGGVGALCIGTTSTLGARVAIHGTQGGTNNYIQITNPGNGTACIGLGATGSNVKFYNCYTSGTIGTGAGIDIDTNGNVFMGTTGNIGAAAKVTIDAGTTNATTYNTLAARGGSRMYIQQQETTSVSTTAVVICTPGLYAGLCLIHGSDGTNRFQDLVMMSIGTGNVNVINSFSVSGTPASRTYSQSSSTYRLAMGSGTYTVQFAAISMSS